MGLYDGKTDNQVAQSGRIDSGYCNSVKIKMAQEARQDAISELIRRGYSMHEALNLIDGNNELFSRPHRECRLD